MTGNLNIGRNVSNVYYDVTNFFFEKDLPDDDIVDDEGNIVVVDFSDSGVYPVAWEVIRSYFFSTESCKNDIKFSYCILLLFNSSIVPPNIPYTISSLYESPSK